jgi:hypothetical protein
MQRFGFMVIRCGLLALLAVACGLGAGCASGRSDENLSERPWNSPKDWENGLPSGMMEGR